MSTYNCFIRKNNKYLRKKLRDLGYLDNTCFAFFDNFLYTLGGDLKVTVKAMIEAIEENEFNDYTNWVDLLEEIEKNEKLEV